MKVPGSVLLCLFFPIVLQAGPPFNTDDPEPVDFHHWEIDLASILNHDSSGWSGTRPHVEINYGALPNLHLHIITPLAFVTSRSGPSYFGYGDTELGAKYRFIKQGNYTPDVGVSRPRKCLPGMKVAVSAPAMCSCICRSGSKKILANGRPTAAADFGSIRG